MLSTVVQDEAETAADHTKRVSAFTAMSSLAKKMKHGNLCVLSFLVSRSKSHPIEKEQEPLLPANPQGKHIPWPPLPSKTLCYSEDPKIPKTAWEYYNEGTYPTTSPAIP